MSKHLTPIEVVEALIGKPEVIGGICRIDPKAAFGWRHAVKRRAAGDLPYVAHMRSLLDFSRPRQLGLTADHLIWGASEEEVAAILAARDGGQVDFATSRMAAE